MKEIIPFAVIFIAIVLVLVYMRRKDGISSKEQYDERQSINRGRAFRLSTITMMAAGAAYYYFTAFWETPVMENGVASLFIVCIGIVSFSVYAVINDCFFGFNGKMQGSVHPLFYMALLFGIVIINGIAGIRILINHEMLKNGVLTHNCGGFVLAGTFMIVLITMAIKYIAGRKNAEREEE